MNKLAKKAINTSIVLTLGFAIGWLCHKHISKVIKAKEESNDVDDIDDINIDNDEKFYDWIFNEGEALSPSDINSTASFSLSDFNTTEEINDNASINNDDIEELYIDDFDDNDDNDEYAALNENISTEKDEYTEQKRQYIRDKYSLS